MLTGTLVTAAGFLPIATAASRTGEYTRSLFQVVTIALVVSWIAAVLFIPYLGDRMLPDLHTKHRKRTIRTRTRFYQRFRGLLDWCLAHRKSSSR
jgi:multidrug efflux pump